jgi:hypothetical protein
MAVYKVLTSDVYAKQVHKDVDPWGNPIYELVYDSAPFEAKVQEALAKGATLVGGLSIAPIGEGLGQTLVYTQAVLFPQ